jgi:hypothetical protein
MMANPSVSAYFGVWHEPPIRIPQSEIQGRQDVRAGNVPNGFIVHVPERENQRERFSELSASWTYRAR